MWHPFLGISWGIAKLANANEDIEQLQTKNAQIHSYTGELDQELNFANDHGKALVVGQHQKQRISGNSK